MVFREIRYAASLAFVMVLALTALVVLGPVSAVSANPPPQGTVPSSNISQTNGPLVVLFDVSGSMDDADNQGVNKLASAKKSMIGLLRSHSGSNPLGLWVYPGGISDQSGCSPGYWIDQMSPLDNPDATDMSATINLLQAYGDTPTGPALDSVVKNLQDSGFDNATILLVSDGESNCGEPPCEVAKRLAASGFDLQIPTVGFDISEEGRAELECIANATGATYAAADNSAALLEELSKYETKDLELSVTAPTTIRAGGNAELVATVTNPSRQRLSGLDASLVINEGLSREIFPTPLSPRRSLAALEPGDSITVRWIITGALGKTGTAGWTVLVGAKGLGAVKETGEIKVTNELLTRTDGGPVLKAIDGPIVVMGDSYSSGEGVGNYLPGSDSHHDLCHRSKGAYGGLLGDGTTEIFACSGAVTPNLTTQKQTINGSTRVRSSQLAELASQGVVPGAVLLTTGGNDIGFGTIVGGCAWATSDCTNDPGFTQRVLRHGSSLQGTFKDAYEAISTQINSAKNISKRGGKLAPVIVSPYPDMLWESSRGRCLALPLGLSPTEIHFGKQIIQSLNTSAERAVLELQEEGYPVYFADEVFSFAQPNHTMCEAGGEHFVAPSFSTGATGKLQEWLANRSDISQEMAHPNAKGHEAWSQAIISWSQSERALPADEFPSRSTLQSMVSRTTGALEQPVLRSSHALTLVLGDIGEGGTAVAAVSTPLSMRAGDVIQVEVVGGMPGTTITLQFHSTPWTLGSLEVGEDGLALATVELPPIVDAGVHTISADGLDPEGNFVAVDYPVTVKAAIPLWLVLVSGFGVLCLLAGIALLIASRVKRRRALPRAAEGSY